MPQLFDIGSPTMSGIPMEIDDPFKTSNPAQKRSIEDPDPNYGTLITKPKSKPKPTPKAMSKPSPKLQPAPDPLVSSSSSSSSSAAAAAVIVSSDDDKVKTTSIKKKVKKIKKTDPEETGTEITVDPEVTGTMKVKKTTTGSQKVNLKLPGYWTRNFDVDKLQAELKKRDVNLTPVQLAGKFKLKKKELVDMIVTIENKGSNVSKK